MKIPQGYKQTEFGNIPNDWILCTFNDVLTTFSSGATPYRGIPEYFNGNIRWISSGELNYNIIYDTIEHISEAAVKNTHLHIHSPGTFLMAITGLEAEGTRGKCAFVGAASTTNQSCLAINGTDRMDTEYLFWFYRMWGQYLAFKYCQGTKQQSYTAELVKKLPIYCPPTIEEQRRIAEVLSDVDGLITALDKKIAKKKLIKQAAMQQLLTGKKRLQGFTDDWSNRTFQQIFQHISTRGYHIDASEYTSVGKTPIIDQGKDRIIGYTNKKSFECPHKGIIVFGDHTRIFKYVDFNFCVGADGTQTLICNDGFDTKYIYYICSSAEIPNTGYNRHFKFLKAYEFFISPNIKEQQAIATFLSDMDAEISDLERKRDKYKLLKNGIMQKLLTGQIRLK